MTSHQEHPLSRLTVLEARNAWPVQPPRLLHAEQYEIWGTPPHPYEDASIWHRRVPLRAVGLAVSFSCGALSVVIGLSLLQL